MASTQRGTYATTDLTPPEKAKAWAAAVTAARGQPWAADLKAIADHTDTTHPGEPTASRAAAAWDEATTKGATKPWRQDLQRIAADVRSNTRGAVKAATTAPGGVAEEHRRDLAAYFGLEWPAT